MLSKREQAFLSVARYLAQKSSARKKHGAVLVRGGRVIGTGYNKDRNDPLNVSPEHIKMHCSVHAEIVAMKEANFDVRGAVLYIARVNKFGEDRYSKPCERCMVAINNNNIKKIIYTRSNDVN
jgi:deoxycytidylate deaminase